MPVGLVFLTPQKVPPLAIVLSGRAIEIGRDPACLVRLAEPTVGSRHLTLRRRGQAYLMNDEGSLNGTVVLARGEVDAVVLGPDAPRVIQDRDRVHLGHVAIEFRTEAPFFDEDEVELLTEARAVPEHSVRAALERLGIVVSEATLSQAIEALLSAPEELVQSPGSSRIESERRANAGATDDILLRDPSRLDWVISLCALGLLSGAGAALYQLMARN